MYVRLLLILALFAVAFSAPAVQAQTTAQSDDRDDTVTPTDPDAPPGLRPNVGAEASAADGPEAEASSSSSDEVGCADDGGLALTPFTGVASSPDSACIDARTGIVGDVNPPTAAEEQVRAQILQDGVHVVHFWAPWCGNSIAELRAGWYEVIERHPDVTFTFVTVWNDGETGQETLDRYAIPDRVEVLTQSDFGASSDKSQRRRTFLGLPVTWIPTTWVFHENGELAVAYNYGELDMAQIDSALDLVTADWSY